MQLQCRCCRGLALCNPEQTRSVGKSDRVRLDNIIRGKRLGCTGCQLICESLPLLNDYYKGPDEPSDLFLYAGSHGADKHHSEAYWSLNFGEYLSDNTWTHIGKLELCKTTGRQNS